MKPLQIPSIDSLSLAVMTLDAQLCIRWMNVAAEQLLGESRRGLLMQPWRAVLLPSRELENALVAALHNRREIRLFDVGTSMPTAHPVSLEVMIMPLDDGLLLELRDLAPEQYRVQSVVGDNGQQALIELLQGMAHEIKNPLGGLSGAAQLLRSELRDQPIFHEYLDVILAESARLSALVDRMLKPHQETEAQRVNVHRALERVRQLVQAQAGEGIEVVRDYDPSLPEVHADEDSLVQAFLNIAVNAVEALSGRGRVTLRTRIAQHITVKGEAHRMAVRIEICDNGPGIAPAMLNRVFFPMVTSKAQGTGLGLSIANTLVVKQRGHLSVHSRAGETRFSVLLPTVEE